MADAKASTEAPTPPASDRSIFDSGTTPGLAPGSVGAPRAFDAKRNEI
jgi:hypothetical protein